MHLEIYADGASSGNPGPAAIGVIIKNEKSQKLTEISQYLGLTTNNQAEYQAVIAALKAAIKFKAVQVTLYLDSELIVRQFAGEYRVKNPSLRKLYLEAQRLGRSFKNLTINHITHQQNKDAHGLAKAALKRF